MNNIIDYLHSHGDFDFDHSPFSIVDSLILSILAFSDFKDIVAKPEESVTISLRRAVEQQRFFSKTKIRAM